MSFAEGCFLGEGLHCKLLAVFQPLDQVDSCIVAFPYLLDRFELLVKAHLIEILSEDPTPDLLPVTNQSKAKDPVHQSKGENIVLDGKPESKLKHNELILEHDGLAMHTNIRWQLLSSNHPLRLEDYLPQLSRGTSSKDVYFHDFSS